MYAYKFLRDIIFAVFTGNLSSTKSKFSNFFKKSNHNAYGAEGLITNDLKKTAEYQLFVKITSLKNLFTNVTVL